MGSPQATRRPCAFTRPGYGPPVLQIFRLPDHSSACAVARGLQRHGLTTRAGMRHHLAYLAVRSERGDVGALVQELAPTAVRVNLEHLPTPLPDDVSLFS